MSFTDTGEVLVGQDAADILRSHPERSVTGFKRLIGRDYEDVRNFVNNTHYMIVEKEGKPVIEIPLASGSKQFLPTEILTLVLRELKSVAEDFVGGSIEQAVLTVPASFSHDQQVRFRSDAFEISR